MVTENTTSPIDCACVIHGTAYDWTYVDRLYNMLSRHITLPIRLHVYTEAHREVPAPYIKHVLEDWGISGPKRSWWYKIQLFDPKHHSGPLLYFDLDTVIVNNLDWMVQFSPNYFWTVRDFSYLWKPESYTINSSIMWFDTSKFTYIWDDFKSRDLHKVLMKYTGDQNYLTEMIKPDKRRFFDQKRVQSWRWQCLDGGYNFTKKQHLEPNTGTLIVDPISVLVFHGKPKPIDITDPVVIQHWQ